MKIYVVQGSTGEYSDHREWLVKAFKSEDSAKAFVVKLSELSRVVEIEGDRQVPNPSSFFKTIEFKYFSKEWREYLKTSELFKYDPKLDYDYTGVHYTYFEVELDE